MNLSKEEGNYKNLGLDLMEKFFESDFADKYYVNLVGEKQ